MTDGLRRGESDMQQSDRVKPATASRDGRNITKGLDAMNADELTATIEYMAGTLRDIADGRARWTAESMAEMAGDALAERGLE